MAMEGWLQKRTPWSRHGEKRRYFVLDLQKRELAYYKVMHGRTVQGAEPPVLASIRLGAIYLEEAVSIDESQIEHGVFDLVTPHHVHELRAASAELARQWVSALRPLASDDVAQGRQEGASTWSAGATLRGYSPPRWATPSVPWCVEAVWLDGHHHGADDHVDAPLHLVADLGTAEPEGGFKTKVLLADGTTLVLDSKVDCMTDGRFHEVAHAGEYSLLARFTDDMEGSSPASHSSFASGESCKGDPQDSLPNVAPAAAFTGGAALALAVLAAAPNGALQLAPVLCAALLATALALWAVASGATKRASWLAPAAATSPTCASTKSVASKPSSWRLELKSVVKAPQSLKQPSKEGSGPLCAADRSRRRSHPQRQPSMSARALCTDGLLDLKVARSLLPGGALDFSGTWQLSLKRSDDPSDLLKALGVPWAARAALRHASRQLVIEHDGLEWMETNITPVIRRTTKMMLDGSVHQEDSPVDKSTITMISRFEEEGRCVLTCSTFPDGVRSQVVRRYLEDCGKTYHVLNRLTVGTQQVITTNSFFERSHG